jgi:translation initiation factor IF-3
VADELRINHQITISPVRAIDEEGQDIGVLPLQDALRKAEAVGLDLVEIAPQARPPGCKFLNYGKFRYEQQKKKAEAKKKQKVVELKEIKMRPHIEENDFQVKLRKAKEFLEEGDKVKFTVRFRGREIQRQDFAVTVLNRFKEELKDLATIESESKMEGRQMSMIVGPA